MLRYNPIPWALASILLVAGSVACTGEGGAGTSQDGEEAHESAELALHMAHLQRWTHKMTLSIRARNPELADFYMHEVEETVETIQQEVPTYEGHAIADLTEQMLVPSVEAAAKALDDRAWSTLDQRVEELSQACNQCHAATEHAFIQIELQDVSNAYAQEFSAQGP